jgi:uncharacterized membrane protein YgdD (TMEM256/DUF423 family)
MANQINTKRLYIILFVLGAIAVILGAFGAHYLADRLAAKQLNSFKTAVFYQFIHVISALVMLLIAEFKNNSFLIWSARLFIIGIILFSGSLYLLSTRELIGLNFYKWLGPITPIGGIFFVAGWFVAAFSMATNDVK